MGCNSGGGFKSGSKVSFTINGQRQTGKITNVENSLFGKSYTVEYKQNGKGKTKKATIDRDNSIRKA